MGMTKVEKSKNPRKNVRRVATERASQCCIGGTVSAPQECVGGYIIA